MHTASLFANSEIRPIWKLRSRRVPRLVWRKIALWAERARQRQALAGLDDQMLRDIGITRYEAVRECEKPFWR